MGVLPRWQLYLACQCSKYQARRVDQQLVTFVVLKFLARVQISRAVHPFPRSSHSVKAEKTVPRRS
eukprot:5836280-Amphidinium_carterae.2